MIKINKTADGGGWYRPKYWNGIVLDYIMVQDQGGVRKDIFVLGLCVPFDIKDEVKKWCKQYSGTWSGYPHGYWYVPLAGKNFREIASRFVELMQDAIAKFGASLKIAGELEIAVQASIRSEAFEFLETEIEKSFDIPRPQKGDMVMSPKQMVTDIQEDFDSGELTGAVEGAGRVEVYRVKPCGQDWLEWRQVWDKAGNLYWCEVDGDFGLSSTGKARLVR